MPRFRKTSRLTKKGGSDNSSDPKALAAQALLDLNRQDNVATNQEERPHSPPSNQNIKPKGTMQSPERLHNPSGPVAAAMGNAFGFEPGSKKNLFDKGGGYKKSRKNSRIKSKRKKGGKSAKKRRRRTRGKKR